MSAAGRELMKLEKLPAKRNSRFFARASTHSNNICMAMAVRDLPKPKVDLGTAASRVAAAAVNLGDKFMAAGHQHGRGRTECRPARCVGPRMARALQERNGRRAFQRKHQVQAEECAWVGRFVVEEERRLPLVGENKIQASIAVNISQRDALADHRL